MTSRAMEDVTPASLVKPKQRVADHGQVFTRPELVEAMLGLVAAEAERIDSMPATTRATSSAATTPCLP